ncbi:IgGFc-binding protein [Polyangium sorediatum]|uniref:IgGFc-binding protein n=1 Tax=Polyangium sorediatum TaxID=889274 RepID=A0ABT6NJF7_9BACT|nr:IgGFc-binding protein [Polyangium sorediatum]MDI1428444.1 IgGFc-binding protein [Polyangium sorediatum]
MRTRSKMRAAGVTAVQGTLALCVAFATWTCGQDTQGSGASGAGANGGAGGTGGAGGEGAVFFDGGPDANGALACSPDLRSIVDEAGQVVSVCPADQGCLDGACAPACDAAAESKGNVGCNFRVTTAGSYPPSLPPCLAVFLTNTWPRPAKVSVTRGGQSFDVTQFGRIPKNGMPESSWPAVPAEGIPEGEVAVLFLSHDPNSIMPETGKPLTCPVPPAIEASTLVPGTGRGEAFHIVSDTPVSAYDILPYGGAESFFPSAQLLFPTSAWGTNYIVMATPKGTATPPGPIFAHVLATEDDTKVDLLPTVDLPAGSNFPAAPKGMPASFTLSAGEYLQWELPASSSDPSGSVVLSDKPVAVITGNRFFRLQPMPAPGGEATHQQILPVSALANEYVAAPYETRRKDLQPENIHYRIVGVADGTTLTFDPPVAGAPQTLAQGQIADFQATGPFRVSSQDGAHPFSIAQIMDTSNIPGGTREGATAPNFEKNLGDEEFVIMLPPEQFLSNYVFFTDPTYPTTNLSLTRVKTSKGFSEVTVDCLGVISGWKPAGSDGRFEVTTVDLMRAEVGVNGCQNGRHTAKSDGPFGLVVWGLDSYASYAYPAGGYAVTLTDVVIPPVPK